MNDHKDHNDVIKAYLLGTLSEKETERLDELSVSDDEFADSLKVAEHDLVDAYVQGELSSPLVKPFRSMYLTSAPGLHKIAFAESLKQLAENQGIQSASIASETVSHPAVSPGWQGWFSGSRVFSVPRWIEWGIASAALLLLVGTSWLIVDNIRLRRQAVETKVQIEGQRQSQEAAQRELETQRNGNESSEQELVRLRRDKEQLEQELNSEREGARKQELTNTRQRSPEVSVASFVLTPQLRGIGQSQTLSLPAKTSAVALKLQLDPNDYLGYKVELLNESNRALWRSNYIKAEQDANNKTISINLPAKLLRVQAYSLQVYGVAAGKTEILSAYPFKVVKE